MKVFAAFLLVLLFAGLAAVLSLAAAAWSMAHPSHAEPEILRFRPCPADGEWASE